MNKEGKYVDFTSASLKLTAACIFGWYLFNVAFHYPYLSLLWGESNVFWRGSVRSGIVENFVYHLLYAPRNASSVISIHIISASLGIFSFRYVGLFRFIAWFSGWMLYLPAHDIFDSGMLVIQSFAFLLIFHQTGKDMLSSEINAMLRWSLIAVLIMGYVASAAFKLSGTQWWEGTAFYYSMHLEYLTGSDNPFVRLAQNIWLSKLFTWGSFLYQLLFPVIIFWKRYAVKWILLGVSFHLMTIVFYHLWGFAFAMIASYCIIIPEHWARRVKIKAVRE
ncbi:MAG: hypothetical protein ACKOW8_09385 [Flavobacteriales bacterium]